MKDPKDTLTTDIFSQDTLKWLENNAEILTKLHDGSFKLSYLEGNYFKFIEAKTIEECVKLARS